jgi:hypothetical protein
MSSLQAAKERFPRHGAEIMMTFSLPNYEQNFSEVEGIIHEGLLDDFKMAIYKVKEQIK